MKKILLPLALIGSINLYASLAVFETYSEEVDVNGNTVYNTEVIKDDDYPKTVREKGNITIIGDDLNVKKISIKEAEKLLKKSNISKNSKHPNITILKNTKGEVVYVGKNLTDKEVQRIKEVIAAKKKLPANTFHQTYNPYGSITIGNKEEKKNVPEKKISTVEPIKIEVTETKNQIVIPDNNQTKENNGSKKDKNSFTVLQ